MSAPVVVLDAGVIDRATTNKEFRRVLRNLIGEGWQPMIPTVVLAEAITGRRDDATTNQAINQVGTVTTDEATARRAGMLRFGVRRASPKRLPGGIDAIVAAHAAEAGAGVVFTTDPDDLGRLLVDCPRVAIEQP